MWLMIWKACMRWKVENRMVACALDNMKRLRGVESEKLIDCMHVMMWITCMCI